MVPLLCFRGPCRDSTRINFLDKSVVAPEARERAQGRGLSLSSFGGERAGTRAKLASPHIFDGSYTEEYNVLNWFLAVERYLYNCDVSDQLFSSYAYTYLALVVQAWFDNHFNSQPTPPWHMTVTAMKSPSQNRDAHLFHVEKNMIVMIFNDFNNFMVLGPRFLGFMGPSIFRRFEKIFYGLGPI